MRVELAVTNERGKWEEHHKKAWRQQQDSLLATAHKEWSKAQEAVVRAEMEKSKKEWEREAQKATQVLLLVVGGKKRKGEGEGRKGRTEGRSE